MIACSANNLSTVIDVRSMMPIDAYHFTVLVNNCTLKRFVNPVSVQIIEVYVTV